MRHLLSLEDWSAGEIAGILDLADALKARPDEYATAAARRTLLMIFEKPSLRTRLSFEAGMTRLGGHAIYYSVAGSNIGTKESIEDTARTASRFADVIMARLFHHEMLERIAEHSEVPVINALTDHSHPCQILADMQTIREKKGRLEGIRLAYLGDAENNVTNSLLLGCPKMGISVTVGCPDDPEFRPRTEILEAAREGARSAEIRVTPDADEAVAGADIVYTDSWMSYHIPKDEESRRVDSLQPYQVDAARMQRAADGALFMNCLPAMRGFEQTAEVIDGPHSIVFDQAENRLHAQKALLVHLLRESS